MKRIILILALIFLGNLLVKNGNSLNVAIGATILFCAGGLAGYNDGVKAGKRYILTGKKK